MAITNGALFSEDVHGTFGKLLCFTHTKSQRIVKQKPHPKQPNTQEQLTQKLMIQIWSRMWRMMGQSGKDQWTTENGGQSVSPYHSFMKNCSQNMKNGDGPQAFVDDGDHYGYIEAYQVGLEYADGEWIFTFEIWHPEYLCGLFVCLDPNTESYIEVKGIVAGFAVPAGKLPPIEEGQPLIITLRWKQETEENLNFYADVCDGGGIYQGLMS